MKAKPETDRSDPGAEQDSTTSHPAAHYIFEALRGLRFGEVRIVLQDGVVVQVERMERTRLRQPTGRT
jgi:hypothetical protein